MYFPNRSLLNIFIFFITLFFFDKINLNIYISGIHWFWDQDLPKYSLKEY